MTLRALLSHRPILQMWTLRYRSGDTALAKILNCVLWEPRGATLDSVPVWWLVVVGVLELAVTLAWSRAKTSSSCQGERALPVEKRAQVGFGDPEAGSPAEEKVSKLGYGVRGRGQGAGREEGRPSVS